MNSPSHDEPENESQAPQEYFFDERYIRLLGQLAREVTTQEVDSFKREYPTKLEYAEDFWQDLVRAYTLGEDLILWAKKAIFPKHGEHASGLHKLKSNFGIINTITGDDRFVLTREESIIRFGIPTPRN